MSNMDKAHELKREVDHWVNQNFNMISLDVYERIAEVEATNLIEHIRPEADYMEDFIFEYSDQIAKERKRLVESGQTPIEDDEEFVEEEMGSEFERFKEEREANNYPMWGTLFEFKSEPPVSLVDSAVKAGGFGVIEAFDSFNTTLFVSGAGYSFYAQHWIPLYLDFIHGAKEKWAGVDYQHM